jgi:hypothetical protein
MSPSRIALAATGTKVGKTLGAAIWLVHYAATHPGSLCWWVAPYRRTAKIGFDRCRHLLPEHKRKLNESDLKIILSNGAVIEFRTAEIPDTLFGEGVHACVVDEAPRIREKAWIAINTTMLQTQGPLRICGNTDKGKRSWFYQQFQRGLDPANWEAIKSFHIRTTEAPHFMPGGKPGPEAIATMRANLPGYAYEALVLAEWPEDAASVFRGLSNCIIDDEDDWQHATQIHGYLFQSPRLHDHIYAGGSDLGKYRSYASIVIIDITTGEIVCWKRLVGASWTKQREELKSVSEFYGGCPILVDATRASPGDMVVEELQQQSVNVEGFQFNNTSKRQLIDHLAIGIEKVDILIPDVLDVVIGELQNFEFEVSKHGVITFHAGGLATEEEEVAHDDSVMGVALAYWQAQNTTGVEYKSIVKRDLARGGINRRGFGFARRHGSPQVRRRR